MRRRFSLSVPERLEAVRAAVVLDNRHTNRIPAKGLRDGSSAGHESRLIEEHIGHPIDVAAACGLGRRDRDRAEASLTLSRRLVEVE